LPGFNLTVYSLFSPSPFPRRLRLFPPLAARDQLLLTYPGIFFFFFLSLHQNSHRTASIWPLHSFFMDPVFFFFPDCGSTSCSSFLNCIPGEFQPFHSTHFFHRLGGFYHTVSVVSCSFSPLVLLFSLIVSQLGVLTLCRSSPQPRFFVPWTGWAGLPEELPPKTVHFALNSPIPDPYLHPLTPPHSSPD